MNLVDEYAPLEETENDITNISIIINSVFLSYIKTFFIHIILILLLLSFSSNHRHDKHKVSRKYVGVHGDQTFTIHTKGQAQKYVGINFKLITWNLIFFYCPVIKYVRVSSIFSERWFVKCYLPTLFFIFHENSMENNICVFIFFNYYQYHESQKVVCLWSKLKLISLSILPYTNIYVNSMAFGNFWTLLSA